MKNFFTFFWGSILLMLTTCSLKSEQVATGQVGERGVNASDTVQQNPLGYLDPVMRMPASLKPGDKVMIITPSWKVEGREVEEIKGVLNQWGLRPVCGKYCMEEDGIMGGECWQRLHDLREALTDTTVKAIWCSRGGYGLVQMLDSIQDCWISQSPKWLIGYSDVTLLHTLFFKNRVASIHGVMGKQVGLSNKGSVSLDYLKQILFGERASYRIPGDILNRPGVAKGELYGGNLTILYSRRGTPLDFDPKGKILFIEDIGERPFEIERVMYNLKHGGVLEKLSGLIVGRFSYTKFGGSEEMNEREIFRIISNMVAEYHYPVCFNFPVGHVGTNYPMILGAQAELKVEQDGVLLIMNDAMTSPLIPAKLP